MHNHWIIERLRSFDDRLALVWKEESWNYQKLGAAIQFWLDDLQTKQIANGSVVAICGDYSPNICALLLALAINKNIIVPIAPAAEANKDKFLAIAEAEHCYDFDAHDSAVYARIGQSAAHPLLLQIQAQQQAGLILFSSGSTGDSKASVLDLSKMINKLTTPRRSYRTLVFLLIDHIGGINTLFNVLTQGGALVVIDDRSSKSVCAAIERYQVELLPTTPTFINMLLIADAEKSFSLDSLKLITYGTEPMLESTLREVAKRLPNARLKQTYGLSEVGILPTRSESNNSLWLQLGDSNVQYKIIDDILWVHTDTAMLGYLNADTPATADGWFNTSDMVKTKLVDGVEYIQILGRKSEIINVGGMKVYPAEVESFLRTIDNIKDATVFGKPNAITGQVVAASINLHQPEDLSAVKKRIRERGLLEMEHYKLPAIIKITDQEHHGARFKKMRRQAAE
jgi:acyl-CoA synthetase (AMP-forming)/AMP-acid ligase II